MFNNSLRKMWEGAADIVDAAGGAEPRYREVDPRYTSKYCYECAVEGENGIVDRRVSADFGRCRRCKRVLDCHLNAAKNTAALHPDAKSARGKGGGVFKRQTQDASGS